MKTFLWSVTGLFALIWSGLAWATAALVRWTVEALSTGRAAELGKSAVAFKFPAWLEPFLDTGLLEAVQGLVQWLLEIKRLPGAGTTGPGAAALR